MAASQLPDYLQFHGQAKETGVLNVKDELRSASIFLIDGEVVYAKADQHVGLAAAFMALSWPDTLIEWKPKEMAPRALFNHPIDQLLFQFAQLEDTGQIDEASLTSRFPSDGQSGSEIKLEDLSHYIISFKVLNTSFKGFVFYLEKKETLVGRSEDCDVILPDGTVSTHHCKLYLEDTYIRVLDMGSTNGTFLNGTMVSDSMIQVGDSFSIGHVELSLSMSLKRPSSDRPVPEALMTPTGNDAPPSTSTSKFTHAGMKRKTNKLDSPIRWDNLGEDEDKPLHTSIFGKMFKKK